MRIVLDNCPFDLRSSAAPNARTECTHRGPCGARYGPRRGGAGVGPRVRELRLLRLPGSARADGHPRGQSQLGDSDHARRSPVRNGSLAPLETARHARRPRERRAGGAAGPPPHPAPGSRPHRQDGLAEAEGPPALEPRQPPGSPAPAPPPGRLGTVPAGARAHPSPVSTPAPVQEPSGTASGEGGDDDGDDGDRRKGSGGRRHGKGHGGNGHGRRHGSGMGGKGYGQGRRGGKRRGGRHRH